MDPKSIGIIIKIKIKLIVAFEMMDMRLISSYLDFIVDKICKKKKIKLS